MMHLYTRLAASWLSLLFVTRLLLAAGTARAQGTAPAWELAVGSSHAPNSVEYAQVQATATDAEGNVFVTGNFYGMALFGNTQLQSVGYNDVFVAKWDATARAFTWAVRGGGNGDDQGLGIAVRGHGVYVTGYFEAGRAAQLAGQPLPEYGGYDVFVVKYLDTSTGHTPATSSYANAWAIGAGSGGNDRGSAIAVRDAGVYVTGYFSDFTAASIAGQSLFAAGSYDAFVAKYVDTSTGDTPAASSYANGWVTSAGGIAADYGSGIAVSGTGVYVTGTFTSGTQASVAGQPLTGAGGYDMFVAKYVDTSTGNTYATSSFRNGWATSAGGTDVDYGMGIAVSGAGVYVTGSFTSGTDAHIAGQPLAGAGSYDMFVAKYLDLGTGSAAPGFGNGWAVSGGGGNLDLGLGLAVRGTGIYVTGQFFSGAKSPLLSLPTFYYPP